MQREIPYLFKQHSRIDTPQAPAYDPKRQVKSWFDPKPASDPITYFFLGNGNARTAMKPMSAAEASSLNLPGHPDYPIYAALPSLATFNNGPFPFGLSTRADADRLIKEFGQDATGVIDVMTGFSGFPVFYPAGDERRAWSVVFKSSSVNVASLIKDQYSSGVGAPGHWDVTGNYPVWVSDLAKDPDPPNPMPVPVGPFADNEKVIGTGPLGAVPMLESPDPVSQQNQLQDESDEMAGMIREMNRRIILICNMLNIK